MAPSVDVPEIKLFQKVGHFGARGGRVTQIQEPMLRSLKGPTGQNQTKVASRLKIRAFIVIFWFHIQRKKSWNFETGGSFPTNMQLSYDNDARGRT